MISDLGNGVGYLYIVEPDKTTIVRSLLNDAEGARSIKVEGVRAQSVALNRKATGSFTLGTPSGVGTITAIVISSKNQIDTATPIAYTGATSAAALAALVNTAINNYDGGGDTDYTSTVVGDTVTVIADQVAGADQNGDTIVVTSTGFLTYTSTTIEGGSDASELYDLAIGRTFFINADYDASGCGCSSTLATADSLTNSVEITNYIIPRSLTSAIDVQDITIASDAITFTRKSLYTLINVNTQASAGTDDLSTINVAGFAEGDRVILRGINNGRIVTVKDGVGNIELQGAVDFDTAEIETAIELQLIGSIWYEISRATQAIGVTAAYRTAGFGFFGIDTYNTAVHDVSGTVTFNGGTASKWQNLTGSVTLSGNTTYALGTGVNGDEFILTLNASVINSGNTLTIFGVTVTDSQALNGGLIFHAKYQGGAWRSVMYPNFDKGIAVPFLLATEAYKALSVTVPKVEATLSTETITRRVSFETGEFCDNQIKMGYPGTVVEIYFSVDKVIAATNNGTIQAKNNAGTNMTAGLITVTASSALDTGFTVSPSGNNTFVAGDILNFTTAKTTAGGFGTLSIKVTKT